MGRAPRPARGADAAAGPLAQPSPARLRCAVAGGADPRPSGAGLPYIAPSRAGRSRPNRAGRVPRRTLWRRRGTGDELPRTARPTCASRARAPWGRAPAGAARHARASCARRSRPTWQLAPALGAAASARRTCAAATATGGQRHEGAGPAARGRAKCAAAPVLSLRNGGLPPGSEEEVEGAPPRPCGWPFSRRTGRAQRGRGCGRRIRDDTDSAGGSAPHHEVLRRGGGRRAGQPMPQHWAPALPHAMGPPRGGLRGITFSAARGDTGRRVRRGCGLSTSCAFWGQLPACAGRGARS